MSETAITRADLDNLAKLFLDNIRQSEERTDERIRQSEERTREHIYDTQNVMLTEFHKWAAPMATRVTAHQTLISLAEERLEILERKVK
jgi:hypothetical protein